LRQILLGNRERYIDRAYLIDRHQRRGVVGANDVAFVYQQAAGAPGDRREDTAVAKLNLGVFDVCLIRFYGRLDGIGVGFDLIVLLLGNVLLLDELGVAPGLLARVRQHGQVLREVRLGLLYRGLERSRIDRE